MKAYYFKVFTVVLLTILFTASLNAQQQANKPRASLHASVSQRIGIDSDITIDYSRPGVKGRKIWGELVPYGFAKGNQYSNNKDYPWRGGANEGTTIEFTKDVTVDGNKLPAGKYSLHFIPTEKEWSVIFNKNSKLWGSYQYNQEEDALRIQVTPVEAPFQEWLIYGFDELAGTSCTAYLHWEELKVPFKVAVAE